MLSAIFSWLATIPQLFKLWDQIVFAYMEWRIAENDAQFDSAFKELVAKHDQRAVEIAAGSDNAGKPAIIRDGVEERPRGDHST